MHDTITGAPSLESLSEVATPGRMDLQAFDPECNGVPLIAVPDDIPAGGTPTNGLVAIVTLLPSECAIDHFSADPRRAQANAAYLARLWTDHRAGRLHTSEALAQAVAAAREEGRVAGVNEAAKLVDADAALLRKLGFEVRANSACSMAEAIRALIPPPTPAQTDTAPGGRADG